MSDVFISYSRKDSIFARRLFEKLKLTEREMWIDWEDIPYSADWWREIREGIDGSECFVAIISPNSLTSRICTREVHYALENNKRIIPIMYQSVEDKQLGGEWYTWKDAELEKMARTNWETLQRLNWLLFRPEDDFDAAFSGLIRTIEQDPTLVRLHTRLLIRAREWETGHDPSLLLRGTDLNEAENWLTFNEKRDPIPTALHAEYIQASIGQREDELRAEQERQKRELKLAEEATENARRAENAEKARAIRFRNAARFAGVLLAIAIVLLIVSGVTTINTNNVLTTVEFNATVGFLRADNDFIFLDRLGVLSTQAFPVPPGTAAPATVLAQATSWAATEEWLPHEQVFDDQIAMMQVPAGCLWIGGGFGGYTDQLPVNQVCLSAFWIDKTEVTQADFARLAGDRAHPDSFSGENRPVENISWFEAHDFCLKRGDRLPTEIEWEYAARSPKDWLYPWGNDKIRANTVTNRTVDQGTADVGSIPAGASWVGALDMAGNVWEWTNSLYKSYPYDAADEREEDTGDRIDIKRVLRGGSWRNNENSDFRAAYRYPLHPNVPEDDFGFRCARPS
ncbi:MAG: SUMF1/EgtB/PvdO family nonheme iron enzyme [Chloroflexota bacterium]